MKILITHELFLPDFHGGGEKIVYEMARGLKEKGIEIKVLTTGNPKIKEFKNIRTIRIPINRYLMNFAVPWICKHAKDVDLIQTNNYNACLPSLIAGKLLKKPVVCMVHGMYRDRWIKMRGPILGTISKYMEKLQVDHSFDKIVFYSDFARDEGLRAGIPEKITKIVLPGIEHEKYHVKKKDWFVLFVGRLAKQKGLDDLIEVAKELPDVHFKLVGSGEEEERLKSIAPKNVEFVGFRSGKPLYELYARAAIFCLPSVAETFGLVLLEAMASGCAIVSTIPINYEGIKVDHGNKGQLKNAIQYLIDNKKMALKMGKINRRKAKEYTWNKFTNGLIKIYDEFV